MPRAVIDLVGAERPFLIIGEKYPNLFGWQDLLLSSPLSPNKPEGDPEIKKENLGTVSFTMQESWEGPKAFSY